MMSFDFVILSLWIRAERLEGEDKLNLKKVVLHEHDDWLFGNFLFARRCGGDTRWLSQSNYRAQPCMFDDGIRAFRDEHLVIMLQSLNIYSLVRFNRGIQSFY
jgi:hypothetical protein